jgi:alginate O-acetyltransferase complex protein AlgI
MLFSSPVFLFLFLPLVVALYYLLPEEWRNGLLLVFSLFFYAWGEPSFVLVMIASIVFNTVMAIQIDAIGSGSADQSQKRVFLVFALSFNLCILFVFKYLGFVVNNLGYIGIHFQIADISLPIGISFFTFQALSYVVDVYRGDVVANRNPFEVGLYISFFPQLIAGPIVRYKDIAEQIHHRQVSFDLFSDGVCRFIIGLAKKIIFANNLAWPADLAFSMAHGERSLLVAWLGALAYAFQILFDFSGYSDMAIGLGLMFGFRFRENFDEPYRAKSITDFWRRWHMSLGTWFRDYVYIPLGGSRCNRLRLIFNLFVVWALTGLWHGASWNFVAWGLFYFVLLAFEKLTGFGGKLKPLGSAIYRIFTLLAVLFGWVLFRAPGGMYAIQYGLTMFRFGHIIDDMAIMIVRERWFFYVVAAIVSSGVAKWAADRMSDRLFAFQAAGPSKALGFLRHAGTICVTAGVLFLLLWSISFIVIGSHDPFIYFNF